MDGYGIEVQIRIRIWNWMCWGDILDANDFPLLISWWCTVWFADGNIRPNERIWTLIRAQWYIGNNSTFCKDIKEIKGDSSADKQ